jgi:hypothetical protein
VPRRLRSSTVLLVLKRRVDIRVLRVVSDVKLVSTTKDDILDVALTEVVILITLTLTSRIIISLAVTPALVRALALDVPPPALLLRLLARRALEGSLGADAVLSKVDLGHDEFEAAVEGEERGLEGEALGEGGVKGREAVDERRDL